MSFWQENDLTPKVEDVLGRFEPDPARQHLGRPFVTAMQLAFMFQKHYPGIVRLLGLEPGGTEVRDTNSLAVYFANELSTRILTGRVTSVELAPLANVHLDRLAFSHHGAPFEAHTDIFHPDLTLFRKVD